MLKVYSAPKGITRPVLVIDKSGHYDRQKSQKNEDDYISSLKKFCNENGKGKYKGEIVRFQYADGYAQYMVFSSRPCELIHLEIGDAWDYPYIERLTAKDIIYEIESEEKLKKLMKR